MNVRKTIFSLLILATGVAAGFGIARWMPMSGMSMSGDGTSGMSSGSGEKEILYWVAPMDDNFRRDAPGKSPMGMDLVPVYAGAEPGGDGPGVSIAPQVVQNLGVRTAQVMEQPFVQRVETVGYTGWDESTLHMLHPRTEGWLERFGIDSVGDRIQAGDVLYEVYAPKLVSAQQEYLSARASGNRGLIRAARTRLTALGLNRSQVAALERRGKVDERLTWRAERDSVVIGIMAREGSFVTPQMAIATLADPGQVWVDVEVLQSQAALVSVGQAASARFDSWPGEVWQGEVAYVYPELNARTRTLRLRLRFDNPDLRLKPNMFARISLESAADTSSLQIPREAVIPAAAGDRVVLDVGDGRFSVVPVITGRRSAEWIEVLDGLKAGDKVVTSGQFLIDSEASGEQALERINALRRVTAGAEIAGFPRRGKIRLIHAPIPELDWPQMNMIFDVAAGVNLMPFNKQDQIRFTMQEKLDGSWEVIGVAAADAAMTKDDAGAGQMDHSSMNHSDMNHSRHEGHSGGDQ